MSNKHLQKPQTNFQLVVSRLNESGFPKDLRKALETRLLAEKQLADTYSGGNVWGPNTAEFSTPLPGGNKAMLVPVGRLFLGIPYAHHHNPFWLDKRTQRQGVDCSNFTALVIGIVLGVNVSEDVEAQPQSLFEQGWQKLDWTKSEVPSGAILFFALKGKINHCAFVTTFPAILESGGGQAFVNERSLNTAWQNRIEYCLY